jgi:hypothetical protein
MADARVLTAARRLRRPYRLKLELVRVLPVWHRCPSAHLVLRPSGNSQRSDIRQARAGSVRDDGKHAYIFTSLEGDALIATPKAGAITRIELAGSSLQCEGGGCADASWSPIGNGEYMLALLGAALRKRGTGGSIDRSVTLNGWLKVPALEALCTNPAARASERKDLWLHVGLAPDRTEALLSEKTRFKVISAILRSKSLTEFKKDS